MGSVVGNVAGYDKPANIQPSGKYGEDPYFDCDCETFAKISKARKKGDKWNTLTGSDDDFIRGIKKWSQSNKTPSFLMRNKLDGSFIYAQ